MNGEANGITTRSFGTTARGQAVTLFHLENQFGAYAEILDYGGVLRSVVVPDKGNRLTDICLGYDTVREYEENDGYLGAVVGRCANRISGAQFQLGGKIYPLAANQPPSHLHGGERGFDKYVWDHCIQGNTLVLSRLSPHGEEGYPGNLKVQVRYMFADNRLHMEYHAATDRDTIVNLTNHAYWNLAGHGAGDVGGHTLRVDADAFTESDENNCASGVISPVEGTPFDLRTPKRLRDGWTTAHPQIQRAGGYDQNWVLWGGALPRCTAVLYAPESGISMGIETISPGLQVYTANFFPVVEGKGGAVYGPRRAVALETQALPNAVNRPEFPSVVLRAGVKQLVAATTLIFSK